MLMSSTMDKFDTLCHGLCMPNSEDRDEKKIMLDIVTITLGELNNSPQFGGTMRLSAFLWKDLTKRISTYSYS